MQDTQNDQRNDKTFRIAIFASGAGSNARKIIEHFKSSRLAAISLIVCNQPKAGVLQIAQQEGIAALLIQKENFFNGDAYLPQLHQAGIDFIVLAGFLWKIPHLLLQAYPKKIVNIHPALLPKYGGKGMYGHFVHDAVLAAQDAVSGITIHYVDEHYDHGTIIFQAPCPVTADDDVQSLTKKVQALEHQYYPQVIEDILKKR